ncbi:MAG: SDR family oxidoreductase [Planctomycetota bacterium]
MNDQALGTDFPVAVVTGAGSGVGRDTAMLLAEAGYAVVLVGRTQAKLDASIDLIRGECDDTPTLLALPTDLTDSAAVQMLVDTTIEKFGRIDALANIAGSAPLQPIERIEDDTIDACLASNLKSVIYTTRACWKTFKAQRSGVIVNVSSMASIDPFRGFNVYAAAKAGVNLFTKATADEGARINLKAFAVAPGAIETQMLRDNFSTKAIPEINALDPILVAGLIRDLITGARDCESGSTLPLPSPH